MKKIFKINKFRFFSVFFLGYVTFTLFIKIVTNDLSNLFSLENSINIFFPPLLLGIAIVKWFLPVLYKQINNVHTVLENHELNEGFEFSLPCTYKSTNKMHGIIFLSKNKIVFKNNKEQVKVVFDRSDSNNIFYEKYNIPNSIKFIHQEIPEYITIKTINKPIELIVPADKKLISHLNLFGIYEIE